MGQSSGLVTARNRLDSLSCQNLRDQLGPEANLTCRIQFTHEFLVPTGCGGSAAAAKSCVALFNPSCVRLLRRSRHPPGLITGLKADPGSARCRLRSMLRRNLRAIRFVSQVSLSGSFPGFGPPHEYGLSGNLASLFRS